MHESGTRGYVDVDITTAADLEDAYQVRLLQRAVRLAIANGIPVQDVLVLTRELTDAYAEFADPASVASTDIQNGVLPMTHILLDDSLTETELTETAAEQRIVITRGCEGGDGECPNACQCGCQSGLYECACWS
jgi:hypothetical protein